MSDDKPQIPATVASNDNLIPLPGADEEMTLSQHFADAVTKGMGSWAFIIGQAAVIATWIGLNSNILPTPVWDPNLTLLNLVLSCESAFAGAFILMSQNRRAEKDRLVAEGDYEVDLETIRGIRDLNKKIGYLLAVIPPERLKELMEAEVASQSSKISNDQTASKPAQKLAP